MDKTTAEQTVLTPSTQDAMASHQESASNRQTLREEIGNKLGLNVGPPSEKVQLANGSIVDGRDRFGLLVDPIAYANRKCSMCHGRGIVTMVKLLTKEQADKFVAEHPSNANELLEPEPGKYRTKETAHCGCASTRYKRVQESFCKALYAEGLAIRVNTRYQLV